MRSLFRLASAVTIVAATLACGDGDNGGSPTDVVTTRDGFVTISLTARLADGVPTFKVDGNLRVSFALGGPFIGESDVGTILLPAGERTKTQSITVPRLTGTLRLTERTFTSGVPFLCGLESGLNPRVQPDVTVTLFLCQP